MNNVYPFKVVSWDVKRASRRPVTGWKTKSVQNHDRSAFWARYPTKATNQKVQSAADLGMDGGSMFYLPRFPTHWHRNCRVPLYNEPHFFCCCAQYASSIFSSYWPNARKLAIPSWMVELVCLLLHYVILWQQLCQCGWVFWLKWSPWQMNEPP